MPRTYPLLETGRDIEAARGMLDRLDNMGPLKRSMAIAEGICLLEDSRKGLVTHAAGARRDLNTEEHAAIAALDDVLGIFRELQPAATEAAVARSTSIDLALPGAARRGNGPAPSAKYADMFPGLSGNTRGFKSSSEFYAQVHSGLYSAELYAMMNEGEAAAGGYLVPEQFAAELMDAALEDEIVRPRARPEPMTGDTKKIAGITHRDGTAGPYGGVGGWVAEGAEISLDDFPVRAIELHANAVKALTRLSNEVIADARDLDGQLTTALSKTGGWHLDNGFLRGTGAGQPLGIFTAPCTITVAKEAGQAADTIIYENVANMLARLHGASFKRSAWVVNPTAIPQLLTLSYALGTAGEPVPVLRESDGAYVMLTRPVLFSEKMSALGDVGDIGLFDLSQYAVGMRADVRIEKSAHAGFTSDTSYYRLVMRADGQPLWDTVYTPAHGATQSPFILLEAR